MSANLLKKLLVFFFSFGAYVPLAIGGWQHPEELNIATYGAWAILTLVLTYSAFVQRYEGWILTFGFFFGNLGMVILGLRRGGYTFNLGFAEYTALYGFIGVVAIATIRRLQGHKGNLPRWLYVGGVLADIASFYPQIMQYLAPHPAPTSWIFVGYAMFLTGVVLTTVFVEQLFAKLRMDESQYELKHGKKKSIVSIFEESFFSLENAILLPITIYLMAR